MTCADISWGFMGGPVRFAQPTPAAEHYQPAASVTVTLRDAINRALAFLAVLAAIAAAIGTVLITALNSWLSAENGSAGQVTSEIGVLRTQYERDTMVPWLTNRGTHTRSV